MTATLRVSREVSKRRQCWGVAANVLWGAYRGRNTCQDNVDGAREGVASYTQLSAAEETTYVDIRNKIK